MPQIEHCVFFKRDIKATDNEIAKVMEKLASITERLNGASNFRSGSNMSPEGLHQNYLDGFIIQFDDVAARDAYLVDDEHKAAGAMLVELIDGGVDGLIVFDLPITSA